jgi:predicted oxidoreductase
MLSPIVAGVWRMASWNWSTQEWTEILVAATGKDVP